MGRLRTVRFPPWEFAFDARSIVRSTDATLAKIADSSVCRAQKLREPSAFAQGDSAAEAATRRCLCLRPPQRASRFPCAGRRLSQRASNAPGLLGRRGRVKPHSPQAKQASQSSVIAPLPLGKILAVGGAAQRDLSQVGDSTRKR